MEPSKIQYIEQNLPALVHLINCTPGLKVSFKSAGLITDEEEEYLVSLLLIELVQYENVLDYCKKSVSLQLILILDTHG